MSLPAMRQQIGLTQVEVAEKLKVTQGAISQWETGGTLPRAEMLSKIAQLYNCTIDELLKPDSA